MKKVILFLVLLCMFLAVSNNANALTTTQTLDGLTNPEYFIPDDAGRYPGDDDYIRGWPDVDKYYRGYNQDWGWTHTLTFDYSDPIITGATLSIDAWDVDEFGGSGVDPDEIDVIKAGGSNGETLGNLDNGPEVWNTTVFEFDAAALSKLVVTGNTGELKVWMDISSLEATNGYAWDSWYVTLRSATLSVDYVPVPGAMILGSLGAGLVGWLRKRRTL